MAKIVGNSTLLETWATTGTIVTPGQQRIDSGWVAGERPPAEFMNWLQNLFGQKLNHLLRHGVPEWNNETIYVTGDIVKHGSKLFRATGANVDEQPPSANWIVHARDLNEFIDNLLGSSNVAQFKAAFGTFGSFQVFTSGGIFTAPVDGSYLAVGLGGGAGGGGGGRGSGGNGGGCGQGGSGGGLQVGVFALSEDQEVNVGIGNGGLGGDGGSGADSFGDSGDTGGDTTFGALLTAPGGIGGRLGRTAQERNEFGTSGSNGGGFNGGRAGASATGLQDGFPGDDGGTASGGGAGGGGGGSNHPGGRGGNGGPGLLIVLW